MNNRVTRALLLPEGAWQHRTVNASGVNFHAALAGDEEAPLVILVHGFPRTWLSWRHTIPHLAEAGWRVCALDLRGFGTSDMQPHGQDPMRMSADIAAVAHSLGRSSAHIVGAGLGGTLGWILAATMPEVVTSLVTLGSPHPLSQHGRLPLPLSASGRAVARVRLPWANVAQLRSGRLVTRLNDAWGAAANRERLRGDEEAYRAAFSRPFAAKPALEATIRANALTLHTRRRIDCVIDTAVTSISGEVDPLRPPQQFLRDQQWVRSPMTTHVVAGAGHFLVDEHPDEVTRLIAAHLERHLDAHRP